MLESPFGSRFYFMNSLLCVCMCTIYMSVALGEQKRAPVHNWKSGSRVVDSSKPLYSPSCWELNSDSLQEQLTLLITESSLHHLGFLILKNKEKGSLSLKAQDFTGRFEGMGQRTWAEVTPLVYHHRTKMEECGFEPRHTGYHLWRWYSSVKCPLKKLNLQYISYRLLA